MRHSPHFAQFEYSGLTTDRLVRLSSRTQVYVKAVASQTGASDECLYRQCYRYDTGILPGMVPSRRVERT